MWEYKSVFKDDRIAEMIFEAITNLKTLSGYEYSGKQNHTYTDYYFDTHCLSLDTKGIVCRIRHEKNDRTELYLKRKARGPNNEIIFLKTPAVRLGRKALKRALDGNLPSNFLDIIAAIDTSGPIAHILALKVHRVIISLSSPDSPDSIATLNLDRFEVVLPDEHAPKATGYEIELKSSSEVFPDADMLQNYLQSAFNLIPVTRSKFRRFAPLVRNVLQPARPQKVFLDVDTGVDDALALLLALNSPEIEIAGITTVGGNVGADQCARNTATVLNFMNDRIKDRYKAFPPLACGIDAGTDLPDASDVHGHDGLGGTRPHKYNYIEGVSGPEIEGSAIELFRRIVKKCEPKTVTLITTGPLTNLAHWIEKAPDEVLRLRQIISMGGVFFQSGNRSQAAEFNIHADPVSAHRVVEFCRRPVSKSNYEWNEALPLTFVGLDVTHEVRLHQETLDNLSIENPEDKYFMFLKGITKKYMDFYFRNEGLRGCYLHDPLAIAYAIDPSICMAEQYHIEVEHKGQYTSGMTVADYRPTRIFKDKMKEVTWVCYKVDAEKFLKLFHERVLGTLSPKEDIF